VVEDGGDRVPVSGCSQGGESVLGARRTGQDVLKIRRPRRGLGP
jgi:hypothetical protein